MYLFLYFVMVLESFVKPRDVYSSPWKMIVLSFIFVSIALFAADYVGIQKSVIAITLVCLPAVPFVWKLFEFEEDNTERNIASGLRSVTNHLPGLLVMVNFFLGMLIGFAVWNVVLPVEKSSELFSVQLNELSAIKASFTGNVVASSPAVLMFEKIFFHNFGVLALILLFSVIYGAGAVLVLTWNASVIATFLVQNAKQYLATGGLAVGLSAGFLGILPHGTFELLAYLLAAIAGGVVSFALTREVKSNKTLSVLFDCAKLAAWSIILLSIGALIESGALG